MELFRLQFPNSELLAIKDEREDKIIDFKLHMSQSVSRYQKHLPKGVEQRLKKMAEERDLVNSIKEDFFKAIESLNVRKIGSYGDDETEMLDFAILIALHLKELSLIAKYGSKGDILDTQRVTRRTS